MYIHELKQWPDFYWDSEKIYSFLVKVRHNQGRLIGSMRSIGFKISEAAFLSTLTQEVIKSSEIEGEFLDPSIVRSSVARHLGVKDGALARVDKNVEGVVDMIFDATQNYDLPLTKKRLLSWHHSLFPLQRSKIEVGRWRKGAVRVVSGHFGKEVIHFEGPDAEKVPHEINAFLDWFNNESKLDLVLKAAIAHLWFVTIHPFEDGNGRTGRAIVDLLLARSEKSERRFYSLSSQIQKERKNYYVILEKTQKGNLDITNWIEWFLGCLERAIEEALQTLDKVVHKAHFWELLSNVSLNERQNKVLNLLLEGFKGKLTTSKWAKITKCSQDTAYRDINDLIDKEILIKNPEGGRSTSYSLAKYALS